jgi:hypothetical protein
MADEGNTKVRKKPSNRLLINISIGVNVFALVSYVFLHDLRLLLLAVPGFIYLVKNKAATKDEAERRNWVSIKLGTFLLILPAGLILLFLLYFLVRKIFPEILKSLGA